MKILLAATLLCATACGGSRMWLKERPATEKLTATPGNKFKSLATLAASDDRASRRMTTNLRSDLNNAGIRAIPSSGRWDTEREAFEQICAKPDAPVDGIVMVSYSDVVLVDCQTKQTAYSIEADPTEGGPGIRHMTQRLIQYLRPEQTAQN